MIDRMANLPTRSSASPSSPTTALAVAASRDGLHVTLPVPKYHVQYELAMARSQRADIETYSTVAGGVLGGAVGVAMVYLVGVVPGAVTVGMAAGLGALVGALIVAQVMARRRRPWEPPATVTSPSR